MEMQIKLYRLILNILFYIFYVLLASIAFSFIFPTILILLWQDILSSDSPVFDSIQVIIFILVFILTLVFRKVFYLPVKSEIIISNNKIPKSVSAKDIEDRIEEFEKKNNNSKNEEIKINSTKWISIGNVEIEKTIIRLDEEEKWNDKENLIVDNLENINNGLTLDIKIGKEIK